MLPRIIVIALLVFVAGGCAFHKRADQDARGVAVVTRQRLLAIKAEMRKKVAAEKAYYAQTVETLDDFRKRFDYTKFRRELQADAVTQAKKMRANSGDVSTARIARDAQKSADKILVYIEAAEAERRKLRKSMTNSIVKLNSLEQEYTALEQTLVLLSAPVKASEYTKRMIDFMRAVFDHYKDLQKERDQERPDPTLPAVKDAQPGGSSQ